MRFECFLFYGSAYLVRHSGGVRGVGGGQEGTVGSDRPIRGHL